VSGTWHALNNQPSFKADTMLLLTDGRVMAHVAGSSAWWALSPDDTGSYQNGSWSQLTSLPDSKNIPASKGGPTYAPSFFASAVFADGTVFVAGGEYNNNSRGEAEVLAAMRYYPDADEWIELPVPANWDQIGDAPCCILNDGRLLLGSNDSVGTALYNPQTNEWAAAADRAAGTTSGEETWTLLPDGSVLSVVCTGGGSLQTAVKYMPSQNAWVNEANTPNVLPLDCNDGFVPEIGPAILLPDGRVFAIGATGNTALYTMPKGSTPAAPSNALGSWVAGPKMIDAEGNLWLPNDVPAVLNIDGTVLCLGGAGPPCTPGNLSPSAFFLFDPTANTLTESAQPETADGFCEDFRFLPLPSGQALLSNDTGNIQIFTPSGSPSNSWRPVIQGYPNIVGPPIGPLKTDYPISGQNFNGLSQAVSYGDDATMATNYPLVRLQHVATGKVVYCKTANHSTMAVATTALPPIETSTWFQIPTNTLPGMHSLFVVANGIASAPQSVLALGGLVLSWTGTDGLLNTEIYSTDASQAYDKQVFREKSNDGPAILMNGNLPLIGWAGTDFHVNVAQWNGIAIDNPKLTLPWQCSFAPAMVAWNGRLIMAFVGTDGFLNVADITGILEPNFQIPATTSLKGMGTVAASPSLCVYGNQLYLAFTDMTQSVNVITSLDGVKFAVDVPGPGQKAMGSPSIASWAGTLWLAWTGTDTRLNLLAYLGAAKGRPKLVAQEASHVGPALCPDIQGGMLHYAWTGTDAHLNLVSTGDGESLSPKVISPQKSNVTPAVMLATPTLPGA
jgi:hypothetical protein